MWFWNSCFRRTVCISPTGVKANVSRQIYISDQAGSMNFVDTDNFYHEGHPFSGKVISIFLGLPPSHQSVDYWKRAYSESETHFLSNFFDFLTF